MSNFNNPKLKLEDGRNLIRRFVHQPMSIDHFDIHASILANGRVVLQKTAEMGNEDVELEEIEVPASLIFKLATLLKATRTVQFVPIAEVPAKDEE